MEQQRISWGELRERAHALRLKSLKAGEPGLSVRVSGLLATLPLPYDPEPLPDDHVLWTLENCHITPHTAGGQFDETRVLIDRFLDNLRRFQEGRPLVNRIL